jgi:multidrug efflux pump subunit AcrA (membrane-fusion protein)
VAGSSARQFFQASSSGKFEVSIQLADTDPRLRSGFSARVVFLGGLRKDVLYVPRQALFMKDGKRIAYVKKGNGYEQREVKIQSQNESRAAIDGLDAGSKVALIDPTAPRKATAGSAGSTPEGTP